MEADDTQDDDVELEDDDIELDISQSDAVTMQPEDLQLEKVLLLLKVWLMKLLRLMMTATSI